MPQDAHAAGRSEPAAAATADQQDERLLDVLRLLIDSGKARTTQDLIKYAQQANSPAAVARLRELDEEGVPLDLAFDAVSVHLRILAHKRNSVLLKACQGRTAALFLPLPPHVVELFMPVCTVEFLLADEHHHLPGYFHQYEDRIRHGSRACRQAAGQAGVVVFEAFRKGNAYFVDAGVSDSIDPRLLPESTQLIVHVRPHQNPDDVEFSVGSHKVNVL